MKILPIKQNMLYNDFRVQNNINFTSNPKQNREPDKDEGKMQFNQAMIEKHLIEQHFHGAYGVNFETCKASDINKLALKMKKAGIDGFYPTLVTMSTPDLKRQIKEIKTASKSQGEDEAKILGIHLEGVFLNPKKKGIHDSSLFLEPTIANYKQLEDDFIKIVTLAPELCREDENGETLIDYLNSKGVKVQAGHCVGTDLSDCSGVTHLFNAMPGLTHRGDSTSLSALSDDSIYVEMIADGVHLSDDIIKLVLKTKPKDKVLLISDCLPCAGLSKEECSSFNFAGEEIFYDGESAKSKEGTIAGSAMLLPDIYTRLINKGIVTEEEAQQLIKNSYTYHNLNQKD